VRPVLFPAGETVGESADYPPRVRRTCPGFAHFAVSGTKKRRSPQRRKKFFPGSPGVRGTPCRRSRGATGNAPGRFSKLARGFFKALFREHETRRASSVEFRRQPRGYADGGKGLPPLEIISAKLLTSRFPVISFRPADVNCGCE
jgi:hypothetical protein